jgi:curved DNA-binding protein CbpA
MKNYYKILNVPKNATSEQIKKKYIKKAKKYHPDKNKDENTLIIYQLISEAYNTLIDPYKRGRYDAKLEMNTFDTNLSDSFNSAMSIFDDNSFFNNHVNNLKRSVKSYSFVSSSSNRNGKTITKKKYKTNVNGKEKKYYQEYETDKDGNIKLIKEKGDKCLFRKNNLRLKDDENIN